MDRETSYKTRKVISIGTVSELTGLSERQIRYYEERKLVFPERSERGSRRYSFLDVETLIDIANKREEGVRTEEIRSELKRKKKKDDKASRAKMIQGQINAQFGIPKK
ncbi:MerR family transcriptional regulator [Cytobacillus firmus]|uniref:MerR family transcriptional regulator n=1 Tax=Cytobacillus firmus TaxID=1399 RepID=A0AA46SEL9_CYTFI|nr:MULTISPECIES: MerR family transcriptional regulator [Bacillaceae]MBG9447017.1 MerR family transcriptional regulator [Cytobacillus firmus]MBY6054242.1 MerR family transcriptional regulator [Cytobacillus firmus]MCC3647189.1 MerR family transcriptional regulator [Cytobacillus oceanisediminis]MCS0653740.1 MerR family transcriptional regulator [Cytobacillus firmus]MCU1806714.1 MerR family transcriptional regulator [Cytobacillus firmus]